MQTKATEEFIPRPVFATVLHHPHHIMTCLSILSNISLVLSVAVLTVSNSIASRSVYFAT